MNKLELVINLDTLSDIEKGNNVLQKQGRKYFYNGECFSRKQWLLKLNTFRMFSKDKIISSYIPNVHPVYQKIAFIENIKNATNVVLIFPSIFFMVIALLVVSFVLLINKLNLTVSESLNLKVYFIFLAMLLVVFSFSLIIKYLIGYRMFYSLKNGKVTFNHLHKDEYRIMIKCFDDYISKYKDNNYLAKYENIAIRKISSFDLFEYYEMLSNKNVIKYLLNNVAKSYLEVLEKINTTLEEYRKEMYYRLAIVNAKNEMIGYIGISKVGLTKKQCEIIYGLNQKYWFQGLAVKAVKAFIPLLIDKGYSKIIATHIDKNINSGKVLLKSGFVLNKKLNRTMQFKNKKYNLIGYEYKENI